MIPKSERERLELFEHMLSGCRHKEAPRRSDNGRPIFYRNSVRMGKGMKRTAAIGTVTWNGKSRQPPRR